MFWTDSFILDCTQAPTQTSIIGHQHTNMDKGVGLVIKRYSHTLNGKSKFILCGPETVHELKHQAYDYRRQYKMENIKQKITAMQHGILPVGECIHLIGMTTAGVFTGLAGFPSFRPVLPSALSLSFTFRQQVVRSRWGSGVCL